jgi:hypothetical protein
MEDRPMTRTDTMEIGLRHYDGWLALRLRVELRPLGWFVVGEDSCGESRIVARPLRKGKAVRRGWRAKGFALRALASIIDNNRRAA